jgi:type I restriction enzyme S subunit
MSFNLPHDWKRRKIRDIAEVVGGSTPDTKDPSNYGGSIPWITVKDLSQHNKRYIFRGERNITEKGLKAIGNRLIPKGSLLISSRAPIGYLAIAGTDLTTNQGIRSLVFKHGCQCDPEFVYYLIKHNVRIFENFASGSTFREITGSTIEELEFVFPPYPEQRKIAVILGSLDDKIELNYEMNKTLEAIAQAIFENWFVDFEPFKDKLIYNKELGKKLPEGWEIKPISEVIHVNPPRKLRKGTVARKISMSDLKPWQSWIESWSYEEYKGGPTFQNGDTLFARITPSLEHGKTALVLILDEREIAFGTTEFIVLAPKVIKSDYYVFCLARTRDVREKAIRAMSGSSGRQRVPDDIFDRILIPVPPEEVIKEFNNIASPLFEMITVNAKENLVLARIRDVLLPKLLSGEIRVKVDVEEEFPEETKKLEDIGRKKAKIQVSLEEWLRHG